MKPYLSPDDLQEIFGISKTTAYEVFKGFEEKGGKVIRLGKKHAQTEALIDYLENKGNENKVTK
jgi:transposase